MKTTLEVLNNERTLDTAYKLGITTPRAVAEHERKQREELEWARQQAARPVRGFAGGLFAAFAESSAAFAPNRGAK